jgi:SAM-dependent methyltransferase
MSLKPHEGFSQNDQFLFKKDVDIFDDFYSQIYDYLVFNNLKNDYEVGSIVNTTNPKETSVILDVGCGTGHHVANLASKNMKVFGIDISPDMIKKAKENYPEYNFKLGDVLDSHQIQYNTLTHILCLYFTIYYFKDKRRFFNNCMDWLMPGGYLIVHLVDRERFDPILPPGNPLYIVSPQKYAKERITKTKIHFNDFLYTSNFNLDKENDIATFDEKFKFTDGKVRKQQQTLYMEDTETILTIAQQSGFTLHAKIDLLKCAYEYQYLYVFTKPG